MNAYKASIKNMSKNSFMENEQLENARITAENILRSYQLLNVKEPVKIVKAIQYNDLSHKIANMKLVQGTSLDSDAENKNHLS